MYKCECERDKHTDYLKSGRQHGWHLLSRHRHRRHTYNAQKNEKPHGQNEFMHLNCMRQVVDLSILSTVDRM